MEMYGPVFSAVMRTDNGIFRGLNLGDKFELVQSTEAGKSIESDSSYLYYENKIDTTDQPSSNIGSFNITYNFDETGLSEIQSDIFIKNADKADEVFSKFKSYFDHLYGESESHKGFNVWSVKSEKYNNVRITLSDESSNFSVDKAPAKISLWIYPDKD